MLSMISKSHLANDSFLKHIASQTSQQKQIQFEVKTNLTSIMYYMCLHNTIITGFEEIRVYIFFDKNSNGTEGTYHRNIPLDQGR